MERELGFPNPIERTDLPKPRRRWRYVLAGGLVILVLSSALLPQILSSRIGRNLLKMRWESKLNAQVWVTGLKTSWWGPTELFKLSITDPEGRQVKFRRLKTPMSAWGLITGKWNLGDALIEDLHVEYVVDHGDGTSTLQRLPKGVASAAPAGTDAPAIAVPRLTLDLPELSGRISLSNATFILTRGRFLRNQQFRTDFRSVRLTSVGGTLEIAALDRPWTVKLDGDVGAGVEKGRFRFSGNVDLGEQGKLDGMRSTADLEFVAEQTSNRATAGLAPLVWVLLPLLPPEDYAAAMGPSLERLEMKVHLEGGQATFLTCEAVGKAEAGQQPRLSARPVLDMTGLTTLLKLESPATLSMRLTRNIGQALAGINPFLQDASAESGWIELRLDELSMPLTGSARNLQARGQIRAAGVRLLSEPVAYGQVFPSQLTTQWQALSGDRALQVEMGLEPTDFVIQNGLITPQPAAMTLNGRAVKLSGSADLSGRIQMDAQLQLETGPALRATITGTAREPRLAVADAAVAQSMRPQIDQNLTRLRQRSTEQLQRLSERQVGELVETVERINEGSADLRPQRH